MGKGIGMKSTKPESKSRPSPPPTCSASRKNILPRKTGQLLFTRANQGPRGRRRPNDNRRINTNDEFQNPNEIRSSKSERKMEVAFAVLFRTSEFGFDSSFVIRYSSLGLCHSLFRLGLHFFRSRIRPPCRRHPRSPGKTHLSRPCL